MPINPYQPPKREPNTPADKGPFGLFAILSSIGLSLLVAYFVSGAAYDWAAIRGMTNPEDYLISVFGLCMTPSLVFTALVFWWLSRPESASG